MAVGKKEPSDKKYERKARVKLPNGEFKKHDVYGDTEHPRRRTVFPRTKADIPETTTVKWMGNTYEAQRTFRYKKGGGSIPAYEWRIA